MRSHCYSLFYLTQLFINYLLCSLVLIAHCSLFLFFTSSTLSHAVLIPTPCEIICPPNSHGNVWKNRSKAHVAPYCDAHFLPPCEKKLLKSLRASVRQTVSAWDKLARNVWIYHRNTLNKEREKACTFFFFFWTHRHFQPSERWLLLLYTVDGGLNDPWLCIWTAPRLTGHTHLLLLNLQS